MSQFQPPAHPSCIVQLRSSYTVVLTIFTVKQVSIHAPVRGKTGLVLEWGRFWFCQAPANGAKPASKITPLSADFFYPYYIVPTGTSPEQFRQAEGLGTNLNPVSVIFFRLTTLVFHRHGQQTPFSCQWNSTMSAHPTSPSRNERAEDTSNSTRTVRRDSRPPPCLRSWSKRSSAVSRFQAIIVHCGSGHTGGDKEKMLQDRNHYQVIFVIQRRSIIALPGLFSAFLNRALILRKIGGIHLID